MCDWCRGRLPCTSEQENDRRGPIVRGRSTADGTRQFFAGCCSTSPALSSIHLSLVWTRPDRWVFALEGGSVLCSCLSWDGALVARVAVVPLILCDACSKEDVRRRGDAFWMVATTAMMACCHPPVGHVAGEHLRVVTFTMDVGRAAGRCLVCCESQMSYLTSGAGPRATWDPARRQCSVSPRAGELHPERFE